jgi:hypothetical protein
MTVERLAAYIIVGAFVVGIVGLLAIISFELLLLGALGGCVAFLAYYYVTYWRHTGFDLPETSR